MIRRINIIPSEHGIQFIEDPEGDHVEYADHLAALEAAVKEKGDKLTYYMNTQIAKKQCEIEERDKQIAALTAEISDTWCLAYNLWPGKKEPSELPLVEVIVELNKRLTAESDSLTAELADVKEKLSLSEIRGDSLDRVIGECVQEELELKAELAKVREALDWSLGYLEKLVIITEDGSTFIRTTSPIELAGFAQRFHEAQAALEKEAGKCPVCGEILIYPRGDSEYCEECGWNSDGNKESDCMKEADPSRQEV